MEPANRQRPLDGELQVHEIVKRFRAVKVLHPSVSLLCKSPEDQGIFRKSLEHDLIIIRGRSPQLLDHEISIVQKAFMVLMKNHEDRIGGIELYVQEIIGLNHVDASKRLQSLQTAVRARDLIFNKSSNNDQIQQHQTPERPIMPSEDAAGHYLKHARSHAPIDEEGLFLSPISETGPNTRQEPMSDVRSRESYPVHNPHISSPPKAFELDSDPKFNRLWDLFEVARKEFNSESSDNFRRTTAARFLRDTIENAVSYIQSNQRAIEASNGGYAYNDQIYSERLLLLRSTLKQAIEAAEKGSGGRKRRFDYVSTERPSNLLKGFPNPRGRGVKGTSQVRQQVPPSARNSSRHHQRNITPPPHHLRERRVRFETNTWHPSHLRRSPRRYDALFGHPPP